jgi:hypothetical protein
MGTARYSDDPLLRGWYTPDRLVIIQRAENSHNHLEEVSISGSAEQIRKACLQSIENQSECLMSLEVNQHAQAGSHALAGNESLGGVGILEDISKRARFVRIAEAHIILTLLALARAEMVLSPLSKNGDAATHLKNAQRHAFVGLVRHEALNLRKKGYTPFWSKSTEQINASMVKAQLLLIYCSNYNMASKERAKILRCAHKLFPGNKEIYKEYDSVRTDARKLRSQSD